MMDGIDRECEAAASQLHSAKGRLRRAASEAVLLALTELGIAQRAYEALNDGVDESDGRLPRDEHAIRTAAARRNHAILRVQQCRIQTVDDGCLVLQALFQIASSFDSEDQRLLAAVYAVAQSLCPLLTGPHDEVEVPSELNDVDGKADARHQWFKPLSMFARRVSDQRRSAT